jgi:hypothetical protein
LRSRPTSRSLTNAPYSGLTSSYDLSPVDWAAGEWIAARAILEPRGEMEALHERALEIFEDANEDQSAFRVISDYVVVVASRF